MLLDGRVAAKELKNALQEEVARLRPLKGRAPKMVIVVSNKDDGSLAYLQGRKKLAQFLQIEVEVLEAYTMEQTELNHAVETLSHDTTIDGIMIDRPLNAWIDEKELFTYLDYQKDIDGCSMISSGLLFQGMHCHVPATAKAVIELLKYYDITIAGKSVAMMGRSNIVGKPLALLLNQYDATVTLCHSKTKDTQKICQNSDIVVVAIGKKELLDESFFQPCSIVVDVGIHYDEDGKMVGDVKRSVQDYVAAFSPVPGGVGPLTNIALMQNLLENYKGAIYATKN